ncbi:hypothetical protein Tco_0622992 [Tanacetum coccineum]
MYYPRFTKVIIHYFLTKDKTVSWRNKIGMHTSRDDYLINTLRFVSANETLSKKKEKMKVDQGKGIELLSEVALTEEA